MPQWSFFDFSASIQTHAKVIGCIQIIDAIALLWLTLAAVFEIGYSQNAKTPSLIQKLLFSLYLVPALFFTYIYWVGYLKRNQNYLARFEGYLIMLIILQFILFFLYARNLLIIDACIMLFVIPKNGYSLLVTHQLYGSLTNEGAQNV